MGEDGTVSCYAIPSRHLIYCTAAVRSQSRMKGDYLFYEEKVETTQEEKEAKAARRFVARLLHLLRHRY